MNVYILSATEKPCELVSTAAGICYGKTDYSFRRIVRCYESGHLSVFEHPCATFKIEGISRSCSHQLVRHRLASYSQQSQRYCRIDVDDDNWYVMPKLDEPDSDIFKEQMRKYAENYKSALDAGVKPENARYLLPEATKTELVVTMNLREIYHFLKLRTSKPAQWEIKDLAYRMKEALRNYNDEWDSLLTIDSF